MLCALIAMALARVGVAHPAAARPAPASRARAAAIARLAPPRASRPAAASKAAASKAAAASPVSAALSRQSRMPQRDQPTVAGLSAFRSASTPATAGAAKHATVGSTSMSRPAMLGGALAQTRQRLGGPAAERMASVTLSGAAVHRKP
jgi:hypothetical protein